MQAAECRTDGKNYANSKKNETLGNTYYSFLFFLFYW